MEWMILPFKRYVDFEGRSQRMEYWMYTLLWVIVMTFCAVLMIAGMPWSEMDQSPSPPPGPLFWTGLVLAVIWYFGTFLPDIAVTVRRLHDQNQSGWFYLLKFIPYVGGIVILVFMCIDGTRGPNQYGPDPKDPNTADVFS